MTRVQAEREAVGMLLREAFPGIPSVTVAHRPSGAPYLVTDGAMELLPELSVSHCLRMAAIALAPPGWRVGVDCETVDRARQLQRVASRFLSVGQMPIWNSPGALTLAWMIKEALYKAAGQSGFPLVDIPLPDYIASDGNLPADNLPGMYAAGNSVEIHHRYYPIIQIDASVLFPDAPFSPPALLVVSFCEE